MTTTTARLSILAVLSMDDHGPCDPEPSAICPHCGAPGRYVFHCLMSDGSHKSMMKGCLGTFQKDVCAIQCERALANKRAFINGKSKWVSRWDEQVVNALDGLAIGTVTLETLRATCRSVAQQKKSWMKSKGYCR